MPYFSFFQFLETIFVLNEIRLNELVVSDVIHF